MARHAVHLIIDAVAVGTIAVSEELPAHARHMSAHCIGLMLSTAGLRHQVLLCPHRLQPAMSACNACGQVIRNLTRAHCSCPAVQCAPLCTTPLLMPLHAQEGCVSGPVGALERERAECEGEPESSRDTVMLRQTAFRLAIGAIGLLQYGLVVDGSGSALEPGRLPWRPRRSSGPLRPKGSHSCRLLVLIPSLDAGRELVLRLQAYDRWSAGSMLHWPRSSFAQRLHLSRMPKVISTRNSERRVLVASPFRKWMRLDILGQSLHHFDSIAHPPCSLKGPSIILHITIE